MLNDGLFDLPTTEPETATSLDSPISPRQVKQLRSAFEAAKITLMDERRKIIQESTGREVTNIRQLFSRELVVILSQIDKTGRRVDDVKTSVWDDREEYTWIDKL